MENLHLYYNKLFLIVQKDFKKIKEIKIKKPIKPSSISILKGLRKSYSNKYFSIISKKELKIWFISINNNTLIIWDIPFSFLRFL